MSEMPVKHLGFIMDGNGRWAQARGLRRSKGHEEGAETLRKIIYAVLERNIPEMSVYAFSTENWRRSEQEIQHLRRLIPQFFNKYAHELEDYRCNIYFLGERQGVAASTLEIAEEVTTRRFAEPRLKLYVLLNYGGRQEIISAVNRVLQEQITKGIYEPLDEAAFQHYFYQPQMSDPDLIIRTAGERRLSNFLLWQSAYSEFYSSSKYWPEFTAEDLDLALADYAARKRNFGGIK